MNEQDRLVQVAPLRRDIDERDVDAVRRKMPELGDAPNVFVPHGRSSMLGSRLQPERPLDHFHRDAGAEQPAERDQATRVGAGANSACGRSGRSPPDR